MNRYKGIFFIFFFISNIIHAMHTNFREMLRKVELEGLCEQRIYEAPRFHNQWMHIRNIYKEKIRAILMEAGDSISIEERIKYFSDYRLFPELKAAITEMIEKRHIAIHRLPISSDILLSECFLFSDIEFAEYLLKKGVKPGPEARDIAAEKGLTNLFEKNNYDE